MQITLGRTGITVNKNGFGALPVQRRTMAESQQILRAAFDAGINYFDTARSYTDSEEKLGRALCDVRKKIIIATKTHSANVKDFNTHLETSLNLLKTDYIDIYQFHNPANYPRPDDGIGLYEAALKAKQDGKIRFIGLTNHRLHTAREGIESGLYDTLQFPFSYISGEKEEALISLCEEKNVGFIAMKALCGGLLNDIDSACAWMNTQKSVLPIWGIQHLSEVSALVNATKNTSPNAEQTKRIEKDRKELKGDFCRSCGYCMPCPHNIQIHNCARMSFLLRRSPQAQWLTQDWQNEMAKIKECEHCDACKKKCPYGLDTPALLEKNYKDYLTFLPNV
ncbi:MAG: aldo/keto reductase [Spirochaetaceae bacterium]|jgi:aryl-alcohol dehydrogenase-like predicted oxidoreductase|nr:aldo/keto reductase [Spirochaetaceae bacterium]